MRNGMSIEAEMQRLVDVGGLHVAVVDAEHQDQQHLGDEEEAEEEGEPREARPGHASRTTGSRPDRPPRRAA